MNVCVVALGKIGLPLAVQFARSGHSVIGADTNADVVATINRGEAPFAGEANLEEWLGEVIASGALRATTSTKDAVAASEVVVVVVPLVVDVESRPDFRAMDAATAAIGDGLQPGTLVIYETTLPVGTSRNRFTPALAQRSGLDAGADFHVVFSPERVYSGRIFADLRKYPKLVGGVEPEGAAKAIAFYESALQFDARPDLDQPNGVWDLGSAEAAELAKLAETTYRDINIAFANELARFSDAHGINVQGVIDACNSQPFSHIHRPGIAVGGHCIPVYPRLYLSGHHDAQMPAASRSVNDAMPEYAVARLADELGGLKNKRVVVLGAAYRGGVKETAFSGVFGTVEALRAVGAEAVVHDPLYSDDELISLGFVPYHFGEPSNAAIVQADHVEYMNADDLDLGGATTILDGRGVVRSSRYTVVPLGAPVRRVEP